MRLVAAVCLAGAVAGCAGKRPGQRAAAQPRVAVDFDGGDDQPLQSRPYAAPGERLIYEGRWMGIAIGRVTVEVGGERNVRGRRLMSGRSVAESDGMAAVFSELWWELETTMDMDSARPVSSIDRWSVVIGGERDKGEYEDIWFDDGLLRHNLHTAVASIRGWNPAPGQRVTLDLDIGGTFEIDLASAGGEYMAAFDRPAIRYEGRTELDREYRFTFWVSDDADRLPLRLDMQTRWGKVSIVLRRYERPGERAVRRFDDGPSPL
jgi:hypothetical protein